MFWAIVYLFCDVTGPNGHFSTWGGEKCSFRKIRGLKVAGHFTGSLPLNASSKVPAKRIRSIQVQTASNGVIFKIGR